MTASGATLLEVQDLQTHFRTRSGVVRAVDGVSFALERGGSLGIVGESGSGKTVTSLSIMRLLEPPGFIAGGRVLLQGRDMVGLSEQEIRGIRGRQVCLVFQDPMTSLNPVYRVGDQVAEAFLAHSGQGRDVWRTGDGTGQRRAGNCGPEAPLHARPARLDPDPGQARRTAGRDWRGGTEPVANAAGLPVPAALRPCDDGLLGGPGASRSGRRASCCLLVILTWSKSKGLCLLEPHQRRSL